MKKILYVEDDRDTAQSVKIILELAGYSVDIANCGNDGLSKLRSSHYDLALLDIMLPDMSGWDLYQKVKSIKMKFAFLSALPVSTDRLRELKKAGLADYITKPFTKNDLKERVKKMLR